MSSWYGGLETPPLRPPVQHDEDELGQKIEDKDISDPQLAEQDIIKVWWVGDMPPMRSHVQV